MAMNHWFKKKYAIRKNTNQVNIPEGIYIKCPNCKKNSYQSELKKQLGVCPECGYYYALSPRSRINNLVDQGSFEETHKNLKPMNPLAFPEYEHKLKKYQQEVGEQEAVVTGKAKIQGKPVMLAVMSAKFMMGSMGTVVGEKLTRTIEEATEKRWPLIIFCASGGARMQEGIFSLMQMAKTSAALGKHDEAGLLYISVLTNPTTGGVTASFAMLGDLILAEPKALTGFAGPRVIEQTIKTKLPEGFQQAEFLLEHGMIDHIVPRGEMRQVLGTILSLH